MKKSLLVLPCLFALAACQTSGMLVPGGALVLPECQGTVAYLNVTMQNSGTQIRKRAPHLDGLCQPIPQAASAPSN